MNDDFYRSFEDRYRGPRALIKERLRTYLPFVRSLNIFYPHSAALDLGCGRGEWLELLTEEGFKARGVDLDAGMLTACKALGLEAEIGDALETLKALPDASVSVVSAFHVVEHMGFDSVLALIKQARRVLLPGGLLILETPNPENLVVGGNQFYMDPSHERPIPPLLLSFSAEYAGFDRVKILRLQESTALRDGKTGVSLLDVLGGVSPDYSIVAQTAAQESISTLFDKVFAKDYGLTLDELVKRHEAGVTEQIEAQAQALAAQIQKIKGDTDHGLQKISERLHQMDAAYHQKNAELQAVYASNSWRLTAPLRRLRGKLLGRGWKELVRACLRRAFYFVNRFPRLRSFILSQLNQFPAVKNRLRQILGFSVAAPVVGDDGIAPQDFAYMTAHSHRLYNDLTTAINLAQQEKH